MPVASVSAKTVKKTTSSHTVKARIKKRYAYNLYNPHVVYHDEHVSIKNPASKCLTTSIRHLYASSLSQAKVDGTHYRVTASSTTPLGHAYAAYLNGIANAWGAMEAPYCGYGLDGVSAVLHSLEKTFTHVREKFLHVATI